MGRTQQIALAAVIAAFAACTLPTQGVAGSGGAAGGATASTGVTGCLPGSSQPCYTGPMETDGVGSCKPGKQTCNADGMTWSECTGDVLPAIDDCNTIADEDCDGSPAKCTGTPVWATEGGQGLDDAAFGVGADAMGNVVAGGLVDGIFGLDVFEVTTGKAVLVARKPDGTGAWIKTFPAAGAPNAYSVVRAVAMNPMGDIVAAGELIGSIDFGPPAGMVTSSPMGVAPSAFVVLLDGAGKPRWATRLGGDQGKAAAYGVAFVKGGVLVTGVDTGKALVAKLKMMDGKPAWVKALGDGSGQTGWSVTPIDDDVAIAGGLVGTIDVGLGKNVTSAGGTDAFVARLSGKDGIGMWIKAFGDDSQQLAVGIAVDPAGQLVVGGHFLGAIDLGGGPLVNSDPVNLDPDVFVAKLAGADGAHLWSKGYGDPYAQVLGGVAVDAVGDVALAGRYLGNIDFGGGPLLNAVQAGKTNDVFVAKLRGADGQHLWSYGFGDPDDQLARAVAVVPGAAGRVVAAGNFRGAIGFGGGVPSISSQGSYDLFTFALDP